MSYLDWKVGDNVVCIASAERISVMQALNPGSNYPRSGGVYTIREIRDDNRIDGRLTLLLVEIDNSHFIGVKTDSGYGYKEPGFPVTGFRKVQRRKTDISIFTAILHGQRDKVRA